MGDGLRGSGFSIVNPMGFQQMRDNREAKAEQLLEKRNMRMDREKEEEKRTKEADRMLKEEVDKYKTEAVLLGLGKGQAESMSLGSLKGWVDAQRKIKVNQIDMMNMRAQEQKMREQMQQKMELNRQRAEQQNAFSVMSDPKFNKANPIQSAQQMGKPIGPTGFNTIMSAQNAMKGIQPMKIETIQPPKGSNIDPQNVISGGGMTPRVIPPQDASGMTLDQFNKMPTRDLNDDGTADVYFDGRQAKGLPSPASQSTGFNLAPGHTRFDREGKEIATAPATASGGGGNFTPAEINQYKQTMQEIEKWMQLPEEEKYGGAGYLEKMQINDAMMERYKTAKDIVLRAKPQAMLSSQAQAQAPAPALSTQIADYFENDDVTQPNQKYLQEAGKGPQQKADLLKTLHSQGLITIDQFKDLLSKPPYPSNGRAR